MPEDLSARPAVAVRRYLSTAAIGVAMLALAACGGTPAASSPSESPSADTTPAAPTPTPTPENGIDPASDSTPAAIVLDADGFSVVDDEGLTLFEYTWAEEGEVALAALEDVFGAAPTLSYRPGDGAHFPDYDAATWDGLTFYDEANLEKPRDEYPQPSYMEFTADQVRGIALTTVSDVTVGDSTESARALGPANSWYVDGLGGRYLFDVEDPDSAAAGQPAGAAILAESDVADQAIVTIRAFYDSGL